MISPFSSVEFLENIRFYKSSLLGPFGRIIQPPVGLPRRHFSESQRGALERWILSHPKAGGGGDSGASGGEVARNLGPLLNGGFL